MKKSLLLLFLLFSLHAEVRYVELPEGGYLWTESLGENWGDNAIIFIHGCGCHALIWNDYFVKEYIDNGFFVIRYDLRDIGLSSSWKTPYDFSDLADDITKIMDAYELDQAHVVGHSMGGMIAQFLAKRSPERVKTLTLMSTAPVAITPALEKPVSWPELVGTAQAGVYMLLPMPSEFENGWPLYLSGLTYFNGSYPLDIHLAKEYVFHFYKRSLHPFGYGGALHAQLINQLMTSLYERKAFFQEIHHPTKILHGAEDTLILPHRGGSALYEVMQHADLEIIPQMGHAFLNKDLIHLLNKKILSFIEKYETDF